jgi:hypothetical protein
MLKKIYAFIFFIGKKTKEQIQFENVMFKSYKPGPADAPHCSIYGNKKQKQPAD